MKNTNYYSQNCENVKNTSLIKKRAMLVLSILFIVALSYALVFYWGYQTSRNEISVEIFNSSTEEEIKQVINSYVLNEDLGVDLDSEKAVYIYDLAKAMDVDPNLAVAILKQENPTVNVNALNKNENGSYDIGMWQLNNRYLYSVFVKEFWKFNIEFDESNWKHNTFIALSLIKDISREFDDPVDIAMAYNCGRYKVKIRKEPKSTIAYGKNVSKTLEYLQKIETML